MQVSIAFTESLRRQNFSLNVVLMVYTFPGFRRVRPELLCPEKLHCVLNILHAAYLQQILHSIFQRYGGSVVRTPL